MIGLAVILKMGCIMMQYLKVCVAAIIVFLLIPFSAAADGPLVHRVERGESLFSVAQKYKISMAELLDTNAYIRFPERIYPGQVLIIPGMPEPEDESPSLPFAAREPQPEWQPQPELQPQPSITQLSRIYSDYFYLSGPTAADNNRVALTFDDGPDGVYTPLVLDVLQEYNVPATFFLIGENVEKYPEVVQRIVDEGHILGNHSWSHPRLSETEASELAEEINKTEDIMEAITGLRTMLMRPPYGAVNQDALEQLIELNYFVINWSVDSVDWRDQAVDPILINTLPDVRDGAIILFHSSRGSGENPTATAVALPELIETLRMQNYTFVTVDELLNIPPYR